MFTRKRMCPFQQNDSPITDQFSQGQLWKKPCLNYSEQLPWGDNVVNCTKEEENGMECEETLLHANSGQKVAERLTCPPEAQEQNCCMEISNTNTLNNNNNNCYNGCSNNNNNMLITPTEVCPRCQAGESGHFGHIGR